MKKILVIGSSFFEPGFRALESENFKITYIDKNKTWNKSDFIQRICLLKKFDVIHYFWARTSYVFVLFALLLGKRVVLHYIGSDVLLTLISKRKIFIQRLINLLPVKCVAGSSMLSAELAKAGISNQVLVFVNSLVCDRACEYPERLSILSYIPDGKEDFYGMNCITYCAEKMPDTDFLILRNSRIFSQVNIKSIPYVEWKDMPQLYGKYSVFVRMTKHDGLSTSVIEALSCARHIIWTQPFPHCFLAQNKEDLYNLLSDKELFSKPNAAGKHYVIDNFSNDKLRIMYHEIWSA